MKQMHPVIQKFKVNDTVQTNDMYRDYFPNAAYIKGVVTSIEPLKLEDDWGRVEEIVQMVSVDHAKAINQDYFEKVELK